MCHHIYDWNIVDHGMKHQWNKRQKVNIWINFRQNKSCGWPVRHIRWWRFTTGQPAGNVGWPSPWGGRHGRRGGGHAGVMVSWGGSSISYLQDNNRTEIKLPDFEKNLCLLHWNFVPSKLMLCPDITHWMNIYYYPTSDKFLYFHWLKLHTWTPSDFLIPGAGFFIPGSGSGLRRRFT